MSAAGPPHQDSPTLSRRAWWAGLVLVLGLQLTGIWVFSDRMATQPAPRRKGLRLQVLDLAEASPAVHRLWEVMDPALFALPARAGKVADPSREVGSFADPSVVWTEPTRWLSPEASWFGGPGGLVGAELPGHRSLADKPRPAPGGPEVGPVRLAGRTMVQMDPTLSARGLETPLAAPSLVHSNLLAVTEVQVAVESDGTVFSAVVLQGSGWASADDQALALARSARFRALPGSVPGRPGQAAWGRLWFRWHTLAPTSTGPGGGAAP